MAILEHEFDLMVSQYQELLTSLFESEEKPFELDYSYSAPDKLAFNNQELLVFVVETEDDVEFLAYDLVSYEYSKIEHEAFNKRAQFKLA